eukprot:Em0005g236a
MTAFFVVSVVAFIVVWVCCKPLKNCTRKDMACKSGDEASSKLQDNEAYRSRDETTLKAGENVAYRSGDEVTSMIGIPAYKSVDKIIGERGSCVAANWSGDEAIVKTAHNEAYLSYI